MIDGTKPELHWQKATQWDYNLPLVLKDDFETRTSRDVHSNMLHELPNYDDDGDDE